METGEVLWEGDGAYQQSILWSPEGGFAALDRIVRTRCSVTIIETENWTSWDFALPDGSPVPEYTFLAEDEPWGVWRSENSLDLALGGNGNGEPRLYYTCAAVVEDAQVTGEAREAGREILLEEQDFNHDGAPERIELLTVWFPGRKGEAAEYYELRILDWDPPRRGKRRLRLSAGGGGLPAPIQSLYGPGDCQLYL